MNNIDDIPIAEPKQLFDVSVYEGVRVKIDSVEKKEVLDYFSGPDHTFVASPSAKKWIIEVITEPIKEIVNGKMAGEVIKFSDSDGNLREWRVTARFNLQLDKNNNLVISKHPKANLWKFMRKLGANKPSEMKDRLVTLTAVPSNREGDDRKFLRIVGSF